MHKFLLVCAATLTILASACSKQPLVTQATPKQPRMLGVTDEVRILLVHLHTSDVAYWINLQAEFGEFLPGLHIVGVDIQNKVGDIVTALIFLVPTEHLEKYKQSKEDMKQKPQQPKQRPGADQPGVVSPA